MKRAFFLTLLGVASLSACSTMGPPYIKGETGCDEIVDARAKLDCLERADRTEREWRENKRREAEEKDKDAQS